MYIIKVSQKHIPRQKIIDSDADLPSKTKNPYTCTFSTCTNLDFFNGPARRWPVAVRGVASICSAVFASCHFFKSRPMLYNDKCIYIPYTKVTSQASASVDIVVKTNVVLNFWIKKNRYQWFNYPALRSLFA